MTDGGNGILGRDGIFGIKDAGRKLHKVVIPNHGTIMLREWLGEDRDTYWKLTENMDAVKSGVYALAMSMADAEGNLLFSTQPSDIESLMKLPVGLLDYLSDLLMDINSVTRGSMEDAEKN